MANERIIGNFRTASSFSPAFGPNRRAYNVGIEERRTARELATFAYLQGATLSQTDKESILGTNGSDQQPQVAASVAHKTQRHYYPIYQAARVIVEDFRLGEVWDASKKIVETTPAPTLTIVTISPERLGKAPRPPKRDLATVLASL
ncbi:MAG: hypothetical protein HYV40_05205 [Candidatus Levybacteria bacterium]|nr:hypothetical protein [Candidatus Levybacteria bacterium]